jgi:hypothetical protein
LLGFALVFLGALLLPSPSLAGPIEADVIDAATDELFDGREWIDVERAAWDAWIENAVDIFDDTQPGDCASYAAITVSYLTHLRDAYATIEERSWHWDAAFTVVFQFDQYKYLCTQEQA